MSGLLDPALGAAFPHRPIAAVFLTPSEPKVPTLVNHKSNVGKVGQSGWAMRRRLAGRKTPVSGRFLRYQVMVRVSSNAISAHYRPLVQSKSKGGSGQTALSRPFRIRRKLPSDLEEDQLVAALDTNVEAVERHAILLARLVGDEGAAPVLGDQLQN